MNERLVPDQVMRSCRDCGGPQRHYRMTDVMLEEEYPVAEFQCMGCMNIRTIMLRSTDLYETEIYGIPKRTKRNSD